MVNPLYDCDYKDSATCPHCGFENKDGDPEEEDEGEARCRSCGRTYYVFVNRSVSYTTICGPTVADCDFERDSYYGQKVRYVCTRCGRREYLFRGDDEVRNGSGEGQPGGEA